MKRAATLLLLSVAACRSPTQITFDVSTDVPCTQLDDTWVTAGVLVGIEQRSTPTTVAPRCTKEGHVGSVVVVPNDDDRAQVAVRVVAGVGVRTDSCASDPSKCIVAERALRFIPHESLTVLVGLDGACKGVTCPAAQTCVDGACKDAVIDDPTQCSGAGCDDTILSPGGAASDAGVDATVTQDAGADGAIVSADAGDAAGSAATDGASADAGPFVLLTSVALSQRSACGLRPDHTVACWGSNDNGQLGIGDPDAATRISTPVAVPNLNHVTQLVAGQQHICALRDTGDVWCWGFVGSGATSTGHATDDHVPAPVVLAGGGSPPAFARITGLVNGACAVTPDALSLWCWGTVNNSSALPGGPGPTLVATFTSPIVDFRGAWGFACVTLQDGTLRCFGSNHHHVLGRGIADDTAIDDVPTAVPEAGPIERFSAGGFMACVLSPEHRVLCWGENDTDDFGPFVDTSGGDVELPRDIGFAHVAQVGQGDDHMCVRFEDAGVSCWGIAVGGELGYDAGQSATPTPNTIANLGPAAGLVVGPRNACALRFDGGIACWGNNENGQLGAGPVGAFPTGAFPLVF